MASRHELRARHTEEKQKQNPQELFKRNMAVAALVGMTAAAAIGVFAGTYYIDNGDITIDGDQITYYEDDKTTQKTETDTDITITQHEDVEVTDNTITIITDENETVEVTIKDINIEATEKIDPDAGTTKDNCEAAISIEGAGDVVLELDGDNAVKSGWFHAGVETAGTGMLTIEDEDEDGSLNAMGGERGAGIGGGFYEDGNVTINGGTIRAKSVDSGAGIGGGEYGNANVTITGGTVIAEGYFYASGIGSGFDGKSSNVTISGGTVVATTDYNYGAAGIGGYSNSDVTITGGTVTAEAGSRGAGIGNYSGKGDVKITITGGTVTAMGGGSSAGIGSQGGNVGSQGGNDGKTEVIITGGTVTAMGGHYGAGIGSGSLKSGEVTITGGTVTATGGEGGAGIGGGFRGSGEVLISGGMVTATAGENPRPDIAGNAAAIGSGIYKIDTDNLQSKAIYENGTIIEQPYGWDENGHTHSFTNAVQDGCMITETCSCGSVKTTFNHVWDEGVISKQPTTTEEGILLYTCKKCGVSKTESIPQLKENKDAALDVTTLSGTAQPYEQTVADGRVIFAAPAQDAILTGSLGALAELKAQGATTLVFRTWQCETSVSVDKILSAGSADDVFALTHKGTQAVLMVAGRVVE